METVKKFSVLFGANTKPLEQGVKKSESTLKSFARMFNGLIATYFSYKVFQGVIQGFTDFNVKMGEAASLAGYNVENLSALGGALKRFGGNTDSAISSLNSLNSHLHNAKRGGGALIDVAKQYGITFHDSNGALLSAEGLLKSLSSQMVHYDKQTRIAIGNQLGLDDSLIRAFSDGGKELNALIAQQKRFGVVTQQDIKISERFANAQLDLKDAFNGILKVLARFIIPSLTKLLKLVVSFIEFLKKHRQLVIIFFTGLLIAMTPVLAMFTKMAIASATAFAPVFAVIAVVTAIALIVEDIWGYFNGWDSATGELVEKFPALGKALNIIKPIVLGFGKVFKEIGNFLVDPSWDKFIGYFKSAGEAIKDYLLAGLEQVKKALNWISDKLKFITEPMKGIADKIGSGFNSIKETAGGVISGISDFVTGSSTPAVNNNNTNNNSTVNNNVTLNQNINSNNPYEVATQTNQAITRSINAQRNSR